MSLGSRDLFVDVYLIIIIISPAPPAFCTKAKVAKGGAYLRDTTVILCSFLLSDHW